MFGAVELLVAFAPAAWAYDIGMVFVGAATALFGSTTMVFIQKSTSESKRAMDKQEFNWRKASYSNGSGNCVEVAGAASVVLVRDTKNRDSGTLAFNTDAWQAFTRSLNVLSGEGSTAR